MVMGIRYLLFGAKLLIALAVRRRWSIFLEISASIMSNSNGISFVSLLWDKEFDINNIDMFKTTSICSPRSLVARTTVGFASGHWTVLTNITGGVEEYSIQKSSG